MDHEIIRRLELKLKYLNEMLHKYDELNKITHGKYFYRAQAIECQIDALEELRDDTEDCWDLCYEEDAVESGVRKVLL